MEEHNFKTEQVSKFGTGIKYGAITAVVYVLLLLVRYMFCGFSPVIFTGAMIVTYMVVLVFFLMAGMARRKELGGYAEVKEIFQTIFIVVLFAEIAWTLFSYIYLNFIDPGFMERFMQNTLEYVKKMGGSEVSIEAQMDKITEQKEQQRSIASYLSGLAIWIVVDSLLGLIIAYALKRKKPLNDFGY